MPHDHGHGRQIVGKTYFSSGLGSLDSGFGALCSWRNNAFLTLVSLHRNFITPAREGGAYRLPHFYRIAGRTVEGARDTYE